MSRVEWLGLGFCVLWVSGLAFVLAFMNEGQPDLALGLPLFVMLGAVLLPLVVVVMMMVSAKSMRLASQHKGRGQETAAPMQQTPQAQLNDAPDTGPKPTFSTVRNQHRPTDAPQADLALGLDDIHSLPPLPNDILIRALHFPYDADDQSGFDALRYAMSDHMAQRLINAAEDVLTLLSKDGLYMEDLQPDRSQPDLWRRFAQGDRGGQITQLGGIRDTSHLAITAGRIRQDQIFRDAAHHFVREFDKMFQDFATEATDRELAAMTETRSARAFMLLGRVIGVFD